MKDFRIRIYLGILSIAAILLVLLCAKNYGPVISPDSVSYISTARNLIEGKGFLAYHGPFINWPPLFPLILAGFAGAGIDIPTAALYINALGLGLMIYLAGTWLYKNLDSLPLALAGSLAILLSRQLIAFSASALSDLLFALFALLFILEIEKFRDSGKLATLSLAAVFTALAWLTRYLGNTVVLTGFILILTRKRAAFGRKIFEAVVYSAISALPISFWFIRNYLNFATIAGPRSPSSYTFAENVYRTLNTIASLILPTIIPGIPKIIIFLLLIAAVVYIIKKEKNIKFDFSRITAAGVFSIIYICMLLIFSTLFAFDEISGRLLLPVYVPFFLMLFFTLDKMYKILSNVMKKSAVIILALLALWVSYSAAATFSSIKKLYKEGMFFNGKEWRTSATIAYLKKYPLNGKIYSNLPGVLYTQLGKSAKLSPRKYTYHSPQSATDDLAHFQGELSKSSDYNFLIWFDSVSKDCLYTPQEIMKELPANYHMDLITKNEDGTIYFFRRNFSCPL